MVDETELINMDDIRTTDLYKQFRPWSALAEHERERENMFKADTSEALCKAHAERIRLLKGIQAVEFAWRALYKVPGHSIAAKTQFTNEFVQCIDELLGEQCVENVQRLLHKLGIAYATEVYLIYSESVIATEWKIFIRYWHEFTSFVSVDLVIVDATKSWICAFNHHGWMKFQSYHQPN